VGRSLVLLHGFTGRAESWSGVRKLLPESVNILAPNLLGHSPKRPQEEKIGFEEYVDRLAVRLSISGIEDAHLVGYSMGGRLALALLLQHPALFSSAMLVGTHPGLQTTSQRQQRIQSDAQWSSELRVNGTEAFVEQWERQAIFDSQKKLAIESLLNQRVLRLSHNAEGLALALDTLGLGQMPNYLLRAQEIHIPVEILVGERDTKFQSVGEHLAAQAPKGELLIIQGTGHNVVLEQPEVVANQIKTWL
jgi:2-succinyl-6-hydroxy-2,4-cyclohexadiene-1-carboxylate synthase